MSEKNIDLEKLLLKAKDISVNTFEVQDTDKVLLDFFKKVYDKYGDLWVLQTQIVSGMKEFTNSKSRMEKLAIKGLLEHRLFGMRKVYRLKVITNE